MRLSRYFAFTALAIALLPGGNVFCGDPRTGPDLVVKEVKVIQAKQGTPVLVDVTLGNQGTEAIPKGPHIAASVYDVDAKPRKLLGYTFTAEGIPVGGAHTLTVPLDPKLAGGKHNVRAVADDVHRIAELDTTNNEADFEIDVTPRGPEDASTPLPINVGKNQRNLARIKQGPVGLLFLGDSITEYLPIVGKPTWAKFAAYHPAAFGVSGDNTEHLLWRITHGELDGIDPKAVVILIGTNNIGHIQAEKPEWVAGGIKKIVETVHEKLPKAKVVVMGVFPRGSKGLDPIRKKVAGINQGVVELDDGKATRVLDIGKSFLDAKGDIPKDLMGDALHPTPKGYEVWYAAMWPTLEKFLAE
jgi:lysophospholipase L1-like esterase